MIDQYTIIEKIGSGSYGVVYKAYDCEKSGYMILIIRQNGGNKKFQIGP